MFCLGWFWGDPHITTLDGLQYTFNGLGEYWLLKTNRNDVNFTLQGRTGPAQAEGSDNRATVFLAFAAAVTGSDRLQIEMTEDRRGGSPAGQDRNYVE